MASKDVEPKNSEDPKYRSISLIEDSDSLNIVTSRKLESAVETNNELKEQQQVPAENNKTSSSDCPDTKKTNEKNDSNDPISVQAPLSACGTLFQLDQPRQPNRDNSMDQLADVLEQNARVSSYQGAVANKPTPRTSITVNEALVQLQQNKYYHRTQWQPITNAYRNVSSEKKDEFLKAQTFSKASASEMNSTSVSLIPYTQNAPHKGNEIIDMEVPGVYFCLTVLDGARNLPPFSPYGEYRYIVPLDELIATDKQRLYLLNCYNVSKGNDDIKSYVILAIADIDSPGDMKCQQRLSVLDWTTNDFFRVTTSVTGKTVYAYARGVWTEVFYMKSVNISPQWEFQILETSKVTGRNRKT